MKLKIGDIFIIVAALCFIILFSIYIYNNPMANKELHILTPDKEFIYSLQEDLEVEIQGPLGLSILQIRNGQVSMHSSPCPLKLCVEKGSISHPGTWIACLPNKILMIIKGKKNEETDVDSISH